MKKLFGIVSGVLLLLTLSTGAYAEVCPTPICQDRSSISCEASWQTHLQCQKENGVINIPQPKGSLTDINVILSASIQLIMIAAGLIAFVYLLLGGIAWITSGGDKAGVEKARNQIIQAIIGLIVVLAAWGLMVVIHSATGICLGFGCSVAIPKFY